MAVVFANLVAGLCQPRAWRRDRVGLLITHGGALLLLFGGLLTAYFSSEGNMRIPEGETSNFVSDYRSKEVALINTTSPDLDLVTAYDLDRLEPTSELSATEFTGRIEVVERYENCRVVEWGSPAGPEWRGSGRRWRAESAPPAKDAENDLAAVVVRVQDAAPDVDGLYLLVENALEPERFVAGARRFAMVLRARRTYLPFALELIDFEKQMHPGTGMAKSYKSEVNLLADETSRRVVIQMNEPLRHGGYTFFQSSFDDRSAVEITYLAAVKNYGRLFPYISSLVMCLGLLVHLVQMLLRRQVATANGRQA